MIRYTLCTGDGFQRFHTTPNSDFQESDMKQRNVSYSRGQHTANKKYTSTKQNSEYSCVQTGADVTM